MKIQNQYVIPGSLTKQWERSEDGFLRCRARVLREGIMPYARAELKDIPEECVSDPIMMMISLDTISSAESLRSLEGAVVVVGDHMWVSPENAKNAIHGHAAGSPRVDGPYLEVDLLVTDPVAIARIESGECPEISAAYHAESIFEPGDFDGQAYDARQVQLRYNHIAVIPAGKGRAGADVRILNSQGDDEMSDIKMVRVTLPRTGRFINTDEDGARALEEEHKKADESEEKVKNEADTAKKEADEKGRSFEKVSSELEGKKSESDGLKKEVDALKGEMDVYKKKIDELLSDEATEKKAEEMNEEQGDSDEIIENCPVKNEKGEEMKDKEKEEFKNSLRKLHGPKLHAAVLKATGMKIENMSPDALKGAFKAVRSLVGKGTTVAGANLTRGMFNNTTSGVGERKGSVHSRLGFAEKK